VSLRLAIVWWELLNDDNDVNLTDWDTIKKEFLKAYEPKYSTRTTCANFMDLIQKFGESVNAYHVCIQMAYKGSMTASQLPWPLS
jgi:hypothetical protein